MDQPAKALTIFQETLTDTVKSGTQGAGTLAEQHYYLAQTLWKLGRHDEALAHARQAESLTATLPDETYVKGEVRRWLAQRQ